MKIKAGIIGATGYAGAELLRLLLSHGNVEIAAISSVSFEGREIGEIYPAFRVLAPFICENQGAVIEKCDVVFAALPHGLSQDIAAECHAKNKLFIDLGADFRLYDEEDYKQWYGGEYTDKALHSEAVYALPELFRDNIKGKKIIANPGCYTTGVPLALAPAIKDGLIETGGIIADCKSGVTGAGRGLSQDTHFAELNEAFHPYKVAAHRHTPEIEQTLSHLAGEKLRLTFVPHLLPVNRGILSTCYARIKNGVSEDDIFSSYNKFYAGEQFVRVLEKGAVANISAVKYTNLCDISLHIDSRTGTFIAVSAIDNMVKGAAGQAIQNMNICLGLDEAEGLRIIPPAF